jgi:hypothetical protein
MKPAADYFTATMPEPWQILGLRLRPFSLGHYKLLRRFGCAFVSESAEAPTRGDLLIGVLCCSMKVDEFLSFIETPDFEQSVNDWGAQVGLFDLNNRAQMFKDYIEQQSTVPKYWEEKTGGSSGAHWAQCVEVTLRSKLGWTQADIDTQPLSKAFADYFKYAENEGAVKLMTPEDIAFIESQKEAAHGA